MECLSDISRRERELLNACIALMCAVNLLEGVLIREDDTYWDGWIHGLRAKASIAKDAIEPFKSMEGFNEEYIG